MSECICSFAQSMVGDGCQVCNPTKAYEVLREDRDYWFFVAEEFQVKYLALRTACEELDGNHHEQIGRVIVDETAYNTIIELLEPNTQE